MGERWRGDGVGDGVGDEAIAAGDEREVEPGADRGSLGVKRLIMRRFHGDGDSRTGFRLPISATAYAPQADKEVLPASLSPSALSPRFLP